MKIRFFLFLFLACPLVLAQSAWAKEHPWRKPIPDEVKSVLRPSPTPSSTAIRINIYPGWNLLALPLYHDYLYTSRSLLDRINRQGGDCVEADKWENGAWVAYLPNISPPYPVYYQKGYFVRCQKASTWTESGFDYTPYLSTYTLENGWNLISYPGSTQYAADTFLRFLETQQKANCTKLTELVRWKNGGWDGYIAGCPFNKFPINNNEGYFVRCEQTEKVPCSGSSNAAPKINSRF